MTKDRHTEIEECLKVVNAIHEDTLKEINDCFDDLISELRSGEIGYELAAAAALEAQARRIAELEAVDDFDRGYRAGLQNGGKGRELLRARIAELEAALKPFSDAADDLDEIDDAFLKSDVWGHPVAMNITIGDLRAARAAVGEAE